jgi:hypothetical protein
MATLQANNAVLSLSGTDVSGFMTSCDITSTVSEEDTTAGYGATHKTFGPKLKETSFTIKIAYDVTSVSTYIQLIQAGETETLIWQPEGNTGGKPEHNQSILITSTKQTALEVDKPAVMFEISAIGTGTPTTDMFAGGTV